METIVSLVNRQRVVTTLQAYGTSESVTKSWDTRGRTGKHSEHGTFAKSSSGGRHDYYTAPKGSVVRVENPARDSGKTKVMEYHKDSPKKEQQVWQGYRAGNASQNNDFHGFMKDRYGIGDK